MLKTLSSAEGDGNSQPPTPKKVSVFGVVEFGLGGILLGLLAFFLLLLALNYFNILSLSKMNPKLFGLLPHQPYIVNSNLVSTPSPTPTSTTFPYDSKTAESLLTQYLKDTIKPEFLPEKIEVKQKLVASGKQEGTDYEFGANWTKNSIFFQSNFHYAPDANSPRDMEFSIQTNTGQSVATQGLTQSIARTYLKNPDFSAQPQCNSTSVETSQISFCEYFSETTLEKSGFGLAISKDANTTVELFFSCRIPTESIYYTQRNSCLLFRDRR